MKLFKTAAVAIAVVFSAGVSAQIVYVPDFPVKKAVVETQTVTADQPAASESVQDKKAA